MGREKLDDALRDFVWDKKQDKRREMFYQYEVYKKRKKSTINLFNGMGNIKLF